MCPARAEVSRALVVVPPWNEAATVDRVVREVRAAGFDALVVDDGSTDDTAAISRRAGAVVVRLPVNLGVGGALRCGFRYAVAHGYDAAVQCDADGQHSAELIQRLIDEANRTGAHLVIGSRFHPDADGFSVGHVRGLVMRLLARSASR